MVATQEKSLAQRFHGLSEDEVRQHQERGEVNAVDFSTSRSYRRILVENAFTPVNIVLFVISAFLLGLGLFGDALMTGGLVLANVVIGCIQEGRAKHQLDRIALLTRPHATVIRGDRELDISPDEVVLGDLLMLRPGDQILVDGRLVFAQDLNVDESLLTGESDQVPKKEGDRIYSGSFAMTGSGVFRAERVGAGSYAQQITARARDFRAIKSPLQREVNLIIVVMAVVVLVLGAQVANSFLHIYGQLPLKESVRAAAVIAALVPQGLVFMVALTYAMAAVRMAGKGALIQKMNAVESISHIDVLCLDKTGTLTTNQLKFEALQPLGADEAEVKARLADFTASTTISNRTNAAIAETLKGARRHVAQEVGFDSKRKWSALVFDDAEARGLYVLGAPEVLASHLAAEGGFEDQVEEWANRGIRVLLFAHGAETRPEQGQDQNWTLPSGLRPLGLVGLRDELRQEAEQTVREFSEDGIALKILSGDNPDTVAALAKQAGFGNDLKLVSGPDLDKIEDGKLDRLVDETTIFGRISPQHKEKLVGALQRRGHYVAMIGDGVNDVPALKKAQVSVAMRTGSAVSRGIADIVLLQDSFGALPPTFEEGRRIRNGMENIIKVFLVRTLSVTVLILLASLFADGFPTSPRQSGIISLLTVGIPALALALWARPARTPDLLIPPAARFVVPAAVSIAIVAFVVFHFLMSTSGDLAEARTAVTVTSVLAGLALILFLIPPNEAWTGGSELTDEIRPALLSAAMLVLFVATLLVRPLREFYELKVLPFTDFAMIILVVAGWAVGLRYFWRLHLGKKIHDFVMERLGGD